MVVVVNVFPVFGIVHLPNPKFGRGFQYAVIPNVVGIENMTEQFVAVSVDVKIATVAHFAKDFRMGCFW